MCPLRGQPLESRLAAQPSVVRAQDTDSREAMKGPVMDSRPLQCAAIVVAFLLGRAGGPTASATGPQPGTPKLEGFSGSDALLASRLRTTRDKPSPEECQSAEDIGKVRVYVGFLHYTARAINPTYPPSRLPVSPSEPPPGLWFCAWDHTNPDLAAWYEVPGALSIATSRRR